MWVGLESMAFEDDIYVLAGLIIFHAISKFVGNLFLNGVFSCSKSQ